MPKLIHATLVRNEEHCITNMLESVVPYVDESYIMIDDRTTDKTEEIARFFGCHTKHAKFENFAKFGNTLRQWISGKSDWYIGIAADETIDKEFGEFLKPLVAKIHTSTIDVVGFSRRHWADIEKKVPFEKDKIWFPDYQYRLIRNDYPRLHLRNYVHEWLIGDRKRMVIKDKEINHFNSYWKPRINYNWDEMNKLYNDLNARQHKDGGHNIWPEEK